MGLVLGKYGASYTFGYDTPGTQYTHEEKKNRLNPMNWYLNHLVGVQDGCSTEFFKYKEWLMVHCKYRWKLHEDTANDTCFAEFSSREDAAFFKLTWG